MAGPWEKYAGTSLGPWSKYQAPAQSAETQTAGALKTAADSAVNAATLGYLPQIEAGIASALAPFVLDETTREHLPGYVEMRDDTSRRLKAQSKAHPLASGAGAVAGALGSAIGGAAAFPVAQGVGLAARLGQATKTGAALGALANPGDTEGEIDPLQASARGKNALIGAGAGAASQGLLEGLSKATPWLKGLAEEKAVKAFGPTKKEFQELQARDLVGKIGRSALDEDIVTPLATPKRLKGRLDRRLEEAGEEIGNLITQADDAAKTAAPVGFRKAGATQTIKPEIKATPIESRIVKAGKIETLSPKVQATPVKSVQIEAGDASILKPEIREIAKAGRVQTEREAVRATPISTVIKKAGKSDIISPAVEATPIEPIRRGTIDGRKVAAAVKQSDDYQGIAGNEFAGGLREKIDDALGRLGEKRGMSLAEALRKRQEYDKYVKFNKMPADMRGSEAVIYRTRNALRDDMDEAIADLGVAAPGDLIAKNREFSNLSRLDDIVTGKVAREAANRSISLMDGLSAMSGAASGNGLQAKLALAGLAGGVSKASRAFGNSAMARAFDRTAKAAGSAAGKSTEATLLSGAIARALSGAGEFEPDEMLNDPETLRLLGENVEHIRDQKVKAKVMRALSGK